MCRVIAICNQKGGWTIVKKMDTFLRNLFFRAAA